MEDGSGFEGIWYFRVFAFLGGEVAELVVDDVAPESGHRREAEFEGIEVLFADEGDAEAREAVRGAVEGLTAAEVIGGEAGGVEVLRRRAEAEEWGGFEDIFRGWEEWEVEGGGFDPEAVPDGALEGAGLEFEEGAAGRAFLGEGAGSFVEDGSAERRVLLGEADEEALEAGEREVDQVVMAEGEKKGKPRSISRGKARD